MNSAIIQDGLFKVCENGEVYRSINGTWELSKQCGSGDKGLYRAIMIYQNGNVKSFSVHRLVAEAFLANPNHYPQVNHKDGNKSNNTVDNLEWCTAQQNMAHARLNGLQNGSRKVCR